MRIKNGVRYVSGQIAMCDATMVVDSVCRKFDVECVVTCGIEQHEPPSGHPTGDAKDFRIRDLGSAREEKFREEVRKRLDDRSGLSTLHQKEASFNVALHPLGGAHHLHVRYKPTD